MLEPKLIQIKTQDKLILPGLLFEAKKSQKIAIHLHGNGSSSVFYHDDIRPEKAEALVRNGISFFQFNNRGANYIKKLNSARFGMAYEKIKECIHDIEAVLGAFKRSGYKEFYLIGESTGANKICVYDFYRTKNFVSKYVLLGGGDDVGIYYDLLKKKKFSRLLSEAKKKIRARKGAEIILELLPDIVFSYQGFYDIANPDGDYNIFPFYEVIRKVKLSKKPLFRHFKALKKSTLVVYGSEDKYNWGDTSRVVQILKEQRPDLDYNIIKGADHSFSKHQIKLSKMIAKFLR
ncbi:MAG: alpha/beta hydrolase [Candidatus Doudnabacteria bacterium]|nr:alpha/beta hydrolase [Candidatus Doudnabacteria bacterium]